MRASGVASETKGDNYDVVSIPADHADAGRASGARRSSRPLAENDDAMMELYLDGEEPTSATLQGRRSAGPRWPTSLNPVLCGTAFKNKGVQPMLDAIVDYLPSPLDVPSIKGTR